jgi:surface polysaccharide O-acyltransferase-like enzyme
MLVIETILLWVIVGVWICYKRNWYEHINSYNEDTTANFVCGCTIVFAPISLLLALFDVFIKNNWKK